MELITNSIISCRYNICNTVFCFIITGNAKIFSETLVGEKYLKKGRLVEDVKRKYKTLIDKVHDTEVSSVTFS
jgi:hypothetical protein